MCYANVDSLDVWNCTALEDYSVDRMSRIDSLIDSLIRMIYSLGNITGISLAAGDGMFLATFSTGSNGGSVLIEVH